MTAIAAAPLDTPKLIRLNYLWYVAAALVVLIAAIASKNIWFLNWVHVICGASWTGIDLFMGFILGPILRTLDVSMRKQILLRLTPRTLFLMPTLGIVTGTAGWFLASDLGFTTLPWPQIAWVYGALGLNIVMSAQGLLYLMPTNLRVCFELQKPNPDGAKIGRMMSKYFIATAAQGTMQMAIIIIMAKFVTGI
jgi:hypothetical protein